MPRLSDKVYNRRSIPLIRDGQVVYEYDEVIPITYQQMKQVSYYERYKLLCNAFLLPNNTAFDGVGGDDILVAYRQRDICDNCFEDTDNCIRTGQYWFVAYDNKFNIEPGGKVIIYFTMLKCSYLTK